jgi:hypothetical protein
MRPFGVYSTVEPRPSVTRTCAAGKYLPKATVTCVVAALGTIRMPTVAFAKPATAVVNWFSAANVGGISVKKPTPLAKRPKLRSGCCCPNVNPVIQHFAPEHRIGSAIAQFDICNAFVWLIFLHVVYFGVHRIFLFPAL